MASGSTGDVGRTAVARDRGLCRSDHGLDTGAACANRRRIVLTRCDSSTAKRGPCLATNGRCCHSLALWLEESHNVRKSLGVRGEGSGVESSVQFGHQICRIGSPDASTLVCICLVI
jgi:hypothetical protein